MDEATEAAPPTESHDAAPPAPNDAPADTTPADTAAEAAEGGDEAAAPEAQEPEEIEFDFGGNKLRVPKSAVPEDVATKLGEFSKGIWQDYTRKSGEIAEAKKALEQDREVVRRLSALRADQLSVYARGLQVAQQLEQLAPDKIVALWQSEPDRARQLSDQRAALESEYVTIERQIAKFGDEMNAVAEKHAQELAERGRQKVMKAVPGFDEAKLTEYVTKAGIDATRAKQWALDPDATILAWKAMQFDALQARAAQAATPSAPPPPPPVKPVARRGASPSVDPEKMTMEEFVRWRARQSAARR